MQQDPKIVAIHVKDSANLVLVPLLNKDETKDLAVLDGQLFENPAYIAFAFLIHKLRFGVRPRLSRIQTSLRQRSVPGSRAIMLRQHIVTNSVYEGAQLL